MSKNNHRTFTKGFVYEIWKFCGCVVFGKVKYYLRTQHTPYPSAQDPLETPPLSSHSSLKIKRKSLSWYYKTFYQIWLTWCNMYHFCYCLPCNIHWGIRPLGKWRIFPSFPGWPKPRQWPRAGPELSWVACQRVWGKLFSEGPGNWGFKEAQLSDLRHWLHRKPGSVQVWPSIEGLSDLTQRIDFGSIQSLPYLAQN